jgi:hypothetical protein
VGDMGHEVVTNLMAPCALRHTKVENCRLSLEKLFDEQHGRHESPTRRTKE